MQAAGISDELDKAILGATAVEIVRNIEEKKPGWTATNVLLVFIRSAIRAHESTNALTEILFDEALKRAQDLDAEFARTGRVVGPLHGVPVSLKDHIDIAGYDTTMGLTHMTSQPVEQDSGIARVLKKAGAVPFVKTNIPQTMLAFDCENPLFGATNNPYNPERIPGGSSGGEAALLASDGCVLRLYSSHSTLAHHVHVAQLRSRHRQRHRRLAPHPGPLQRLLQPQALLRPLPRQRMPELHARLRRRPLDDGTDGPLRLGRRSPHARLPRRQHRRLPNGNGRLSHALQEGRRVAEETQVRLLPHGRVLQG